MTYRFYTQRYLSDSHNLALREAEEKRRWKDTTVRFGGDEPDEGCASPESTSTPSTQFAYEISKSEWGRTVYK